MPPASAHGSAGFIQDLYSFLNKDVTAKANGTIVSAKPKNSVGG